MNTTFIHYGHYWQGNTFEEMQLLQPLFILIMIIYSLIIMIVEKSKQIGQRENPT